MPDTGDALEALNGPDDACPVGAARWAQYLDTVAQLTYLQMVKQTVMTRRDVRAGDSVLDAGGGTSDDVRAMASWVGQRAESWGSTSTKRRSLKRAGGRQRPG